jgi:hypothetical protein
LCFSIVPHTALLLQASLKDAQKSSASAITHPLDSLDSDSSDEDDAPIDVTQTFWSAASALPHSTLPTARAASSASPPGASSADSAPTPPSAPEATPVSKPIAASPWSCSASVSPSQGAAASPNSLSVCLENKNVARSHSIYKRGFRALFSARAPARDDTRGPRSSPLADLCNVPLQQGAPSKEVGPPSPAADQENAEPRDCKGVDKRLELACPETEEVQRMAVESKDIGKSQLQYVQQSNHVARPMSHSVQQVHEVSGVEAVQEVNKKWCTANSDPRKGTGDTSLAPPKHSGESAASASPLSPALAESPALSSTCLQLPAKESSESPCSLKQSTIITALPCTPQDEPPTHLSTRLPRQQLVRNSISNMPPTPNDNPTAPRHVVQTPRTSAAVTSLRQQLRALQLPVKPLVPPPQERPSTPDAPDPVFRSHDPQHTLENHLVLPRANLHTWRGSAETLHAQPIMIQSRRLSLQPAPFSTAQCRRPTTGPNIRRESCSSSTFYPPGSAPKSSRRMSLPASRLLPPDRSSSQSATPQKRFPVSGRHAVLPSDLPCATGRLGTADGSAQSTPRVESLTEVSARLRFVQTRPQTARAAGSTLVLPPFKVGKVPTNARGEPALGLDDARMTRCRPASHGYLTERPKTVAGRTNTASTLLQNAQMTRPLSEYLICVTVCGIVTG